MPAPKGQESMSALGSLYDLLFAVAEDTSKKKGPAAVPDLVTSQISDGVAEGLVGLGSALAGISGEKGVESLVGYELKDLFNSSAGTVQGEYKNLFGTGDGNPYVFATPTADDPDKKAYNKQGFYVFKDEEGAELGRLDASGGVTAEVNAGMVNSILLNPAGLANSIVTDWWTKRQQAQMIETISAIVSGQTDPSRFLMDSVNLADDVALDNTNAQIAGNYVKNRKLGIDKDVAAAIAQVEAADSARVAALARDNRGYTKDDLSRYTQAIDTAVAMFAGIDKEEERSEFVNLYNSRVKQELLNRYNQMSANLPQFQAVNSFDELFLAANRGQLLSMLDNNTLFNRAYGGRSLGDEMQNAFMDVFGHLGTDNTLSPQMRAHFAGLWNKVGNDETFGNLLRSMSTAVNPEVKNARPLMRMGISELSEKIKNNAEGVKSFLQSRVLQSNEKRLERGDQWKDFNDWRAKTANTLSYAYLRWQTVPSINKIFTPIGLLTGQSWYDLSNWAGGPVGYGFAKTSPAESLNIESPKVFGAYGWNKLLLMPSKANGFQKFAYTMGTFSPLGAAQGFFNGDLFQRMVWIGSGFGKNIGDQTKWGWMARVGHGFLNNSVYQGMVGGVNFGRYVFNLPSMMINQSMMFIQKEIIDKLRQKMADAAAAAFRKLVGQKIADWIIAAIGVVTGGIINAIQITYKALNYLTLGLLDKVTEFTLKLAMQIVIGVILGIFVVIPAIAGGVNSGDSNEVAATLGSGGLRAPDPDWEPILVDAANLELEPPPDPGDVPTDDPIDMPGAKGIDVSHWNGDINWQTVKKSGLVEFAIIKASEGTGFVDHRFVKNCQSAKSVGIKRSAYHFFHGDMNGKDQANHFLNTIKKCGSAMDFEVTIDVELPYKRPPPDVSVSTKNLKLMLDTLEAALGYKPMIYTSDVMWKAMTVQPGWGGNEYPLWVAAYNNVGPGKLPKGWTEWVIWQYSKKGKIPGIPSSVDLNIWND